MKKWVFGIVVLVLAIFSACTQAEESTQPIGTPSATVTEPNTLEPGKDPMMATIEAASTQNSLLTPTREVITTDDAMLEAIYAAGTKQALATATPLPSITPTRKPTPIPTPYGGQSVWLAFYGSPMDDKPVLNNWYSDDVYIYAGDLFSEEFVPVARVNALPEGFEYTGTSLAWANDGSKIAFVDANEDGYVRLNLVELASGEQSELIILWRQDFEINTMEWENVGNTYFIIEMYRPGYRALYLLNSQTLEYKEITTGGIYRFHGWLQDSVSFVYIDADAVYQYDAVTGIAKRLFRIPTRSQYQIDGEIINLSNWGGASYLAGSKQFLVHGSTKQTTQSGIQSGYFLVTAEDNYYATWLHYTAPENFQNTSGQDLLFSDDGKWMFIAHYGGAVLYSVEQSETLSISGISDARTDWDWSIMKDQSVDYRILGRTDWLVDWYPDSSAVIVANVGTWCGGNEATSLAINILDLQSRTVVYDHPFFPLQDQDYLPIIKTCNQHLQRGMAMDTVFTEQGKPISIQPINIQKSSEND